MFCDLFLVEEIGITMSFVEWIDGTSFISYSCQGGSSFSFLQIDPWYNGTCGCDVALEVSIQ